MAKTKQEPTGPAAAIKEGLNYKRPKVSMVPTEDFVSTGNQILDLGISGRTGCGLAKGMYFIFIGTSGSGKTFLFHTCLAEAAINPNFDEFTFIADMPEDGSKMDHEGFFGKKCAERIQPPFSDDDDKPIYSRTLEDFYDTAEFYFDRGPTIYILDSENAVPPQAFFELLDKQKAARQKGKEEPKSYGMERAKVHSQRMPGLISKMQKSRSILIIVAQSRDNVNAGMFEKQETRSGGTALKFYAQAELWMAVSSQIKKKVNEIDRRIGIVSRVRIEKNRISGKDRTVKIPIYYTAGMDEIGSCIDYLIIEGHWKQAKGIVTTKEFGQHKGKEALLKYIEENDLEDELKETVLEVWNAVEEKCRVDRKNKYI